MYGSEAIVETNLFASEADTWSENVRICNFELTVSGSIEVWLN